MNFGADPLAAAAGCAARRDVAPIPLLPDGHPVRRGEHAKHLENESKEAGSSFAPLIYL